MNQERAAQLAEKEAKEVYKKVITYNDYVLHTQPAKSLKSNTEGGSFC